VKSCRVALNHKSACAALQVKGGGSVRLARLTDGRIGWVCRTQDGRCFTFKRHARELVDVTARVVRFSDWRDVDLCETGCRRATRGDGGLR
jgi:hypothetical protein